MGPAAGCRVSAESLGPLACRCRKRMRPLEGLAAHIAVDRPAGLAVLIERQWVLLVAHQIGRLWRGQSLARELGQNDRHVVVPTAGLGDLDADIVEPARADDRHGNRRHRNVRLLLHLLRNHDQSVRNRLTRRQHVHDQ